MKEIVFNSEQKEILLNFLKRRFGTEFDRPIYHQMYKAFKESNKHFFTSTWSMYCEYVISDGYHIFQNETELWRDLNERIRIPWDENATYQIIFQ